MQKITGIMACDQNGIIGVKNRLPWNYPEETEHFRQTTNNSTMIMGHNTYKSIPVTLFATRKAIILAHEPHDSPNHNKNIVFVKSLSDCLSLLSQNPNEKYFLIGGASVVKLFLEKHLISEFLLTRIKKNYAGDTFFPLELLSGWACVAIKDSVNFTIYRYIK